MKSHKSGPKGKSHSKSQSSFKNSDRRGPRSFASLSSAGASHAGRSRDKYEVQKGPQGARAVVGTHAINEVLKIRPKSIVEAWFVSNWESNQELRDTAELLKKHRITPISKSESQLSHICYTHQNAVLFVNQSPSFSSEEIENKKFSTLLFLDGVEDPHNLGAIMRTAWLTGVDGVFAPDDRAVGLTATVHKVACGGVEHVPFLRQNQFSQSVENLKKRDYWVFGLSHKATKSIYEIKLPEKVVWMIGAEDKGLRSSSEKLCDELVYIPQASSDASYNASVAAAIALAETMRTHLLLKK